VIVVLNFVGDYGPKTEVDKLILTRTCPWKLIVQVAQLKIEIDRLNSANLAAASRADKVMADCTRLQELSNHQRKQIEDQRDQLSSAGRHASSAVDADRDTRAKLAMVRTVIAAEHFLLLLFSSTLSGCLECSQGVLNATVEGTLVEVEVDRPKVLFCF